MPLQFTVARAYRWQAMLDSGEVASLSGLANLVGTDKSYLGKILRLTLATSSHNGIIELQFLVALSHRAFGSEELAAEP